MTAPTDAEAAIEGDLDVGSSSSCIIRGAKIGVKGTLSFKGTNLLITGTEKAVELKKAATLGEGITLYGSSEVDGGAVKETQLLGIVDQSGNEKYTYGVDYDEIVAKKLTNQQDMAVDSNGTYYTTIKDDVENALDGSTVTIIATGTSLSLPDDLYADKNITLDLNGHSLGDDGSYGNNLITRNCNLTIKDSKGDDAIRLEVLADSTVEFRGDVTTTCTYLEYKEGQIKFYGGNIREISYVTLNYADLLPAGYCFYNYSGSTQGAAIELAAFEDEVLIPLAVAECSHPEAKNGKCLYCNATLLVKDNKDTTYSTLPLRRFS